MSLKRVFMLTEDFDGTLAGKVTSYDEDGNSTGSESVDLSEFPGNIVESFFAPPDATGEIDKTNVDRVEGAALSSD